MRKKKNALSTCFFQGFWQSLKVWLTEPWSEKWADAALTRIETGFHWGGCSQTNGRCVNMTNVEICWMSTSSDWPGTCSRFNNQSVLHTLFLSGSCRALLPDLGHPSLSHILPQALWMTFRPKVTQVVQLLVWNWCANRKPVSLEVSICYWYVIPPVIHNQVRIKYICLYF